MESSVPSDAISYLQNHRSFDYDPSMSECGAVVLAPVENLDVRDFWVDGEGQNWADDPHAAEVGYYVVPCIDLVSQVDGFDPEGILVWIPRVASFGSWDADHWDLIVFYSTGWEAIVADPLRYINAQWDPDCEFDFLKPWRAGFDWHDGRPF